MSTEQNYVGRGNFANTPPQTAQNAAKSPSQADNRPDKPSDYVDVNRDVYEAQTKLLALVDDFLSTGINCSPTEAINDLLYEWLTTPARELASQYNKSKLRIVLQLVTFLSDLRDEAINVNWLIDESKKKKEVSLE